MSKATSSGFAGLTLNEFLDAWWEVSPRSYNYHHRLDQGKGQVMVSILSHLSARSQRYAELQDKILSHAYKKLGGVRTAKARKH